MPQKKQLWQRVVKSLRSRVAPSELDTWFSHAALKELDGPSVVISVPNRFFASWVGEHYLQHLEDSFAKILKESPKITFDYGARPLEEKSRDGLSSPDLDDGLDSSRTLDSYLRGDWNRLAVSSALEVVQKDQCPYNPFYVYSGPGLGKTHLLQAMGNQGLKSRPGISIRYVTSATFTSEFIRSWRNDQYLSFLDRYGRLDMLLFDDIHLLAKRTKTQQTFLTLFDRLQSRNALMAISADRAPHELPDMAEALRSRLGSGLITEIVMPDQNSLLDLVRNKARLEKTPIPEDVLFFLTNKIRDIKDLFRNIVKLEGYSSLTGRNISLSLAKSLAKGGQGNGLGIQDIKAITAGYFNLSPSDLVSGKKKRTHSYPRQLAMYLARKHTRLSFKQIGESFGNRDHSSVMYAIRCVDKGKDQGGPVKDDLSRIENLLC